MTDINRELNGQQKSQHLEEYIKLQAKGKFTVAPTEKESFIIINLEYNVKYASDCIESLLGYSHEELMNMSLYDIVPNGDLPITHFFKETLQTVNTKAFTKNYHEWIDVKILLLPIFSNNELIGRYIIFFETSTDYHQTLESKAYENGGSPYKDLIDYSPFGIIILDDFKVEYINMMALRALGAKRKESVTRKSIFNLIPAEDIDLLREKIKKTKKSVIERPFKQKLLKLDGNIVEAELQALPAIYNQKKMTHLIIRDVFETKKDLNLSILIAKGIAHEIKNPLTRVKRVMELKECGVDEKVDYKLVKQDITYIEKILDEILFLEGDKFKRSTGQGVSEILSLIRDLMK